MNRPFKYQCESLLLILMFQGAFVLDAIAEWPFERGDQHASGMSLRNFLGEPEIRWEFAATDSGFEATAVIYEKVVYVGDFDGTFYALNLLDGELLWKRTFEDSGFTTAAARIDDKILVNDVSGMVRCLSARHGESIWEYDTNSELYAAPNVYQGRVLVCTESGTLVALQLETGQPEWEFQIEAPLRCWPTVVNDQVFLAGCDQKLHVVNVDSGESTGSLPIDGPTGSTPAAQEGAIYFGTEQGTFYAIDTEFIEQNWFYRNPKRAQAIRVAAAIDQQSVIFSNMGKSVIALEPQTGELRWEFTVRSRVESSPIILGRNVIAATMRGRIYSIALDSGEEAWQLSLGGSFQASPSFSDGLLVLGNTDGTLYCLGEIEEQVLPKQEEQQETKTSFTLLTLGGILGVFILLYYYLMAHGNRVKRKLKLVVISSVTTLPFRNGLRSNCPRFIKRCNLRQQICRLGYICTFHSAVSVVNSVTSKYLQTRILTRSNDISVASRAKFIWSVSCL